MPSSFQENEQKPLLLTPGRRTGTGSAAINSLGRNTAQRIPIRGFRTITFFGILRLTGQVPPYGYTPHAPIQTLEEIRRSARGPLVLFPECTTSNCRGLLRFADVFEGCAVPLKKFKIFIMCIRCVKDSRSFCHHSWKCLTRYDPPTPVTPTLSHSIPVFLNPLGHIFKVSTTLSTLQLSIRLLAPSESPSSPTFLVSDVTGISEAMGDGLSEVCAALVAQTGRMKRMGLGWEDKAAFFDFRSREHEKGRA